MVEIKIHNIQSIEPAESAVTVAATVAATVTAAASVDPIPTAPSSPTAAGIHLEEAPALSHVDGTLAQIGRRGGRAGKASSGRGRNKTAATPAEPRPGPTRTTRKNKK